MEKILKSKSVKKRKIPNAAFIVVFVFFCIYALTLLYPYVWTLITTFKTEDNYAEDLIGFPSPWTFQNYVDAFIELSASGKNLFIMLVNSVWYACGGTLVAIAASSVSAYVVAKYKFPGRKVLYGVALVTMMLPIVGALPSQYTMYGTLGILNTPFMLITFANGLGFNFIMLHAFFKSLPWSYAEAAYLDGAGHFQVFFRVMLPQAITVIMSLAIVAFINTWNDYMNPILFLESYPTMSMGLYVYQQDLAQVGINIPMLFAGVVMSVIPVLALFIIFQNKIMSLTLGGGLKE